MPMAWIWKSDNLIEDHDYLILRCISIGRSYNDRDHVLPANLLPQTPKISCGNQNMALHSHNSSITICLNTLDCLFSLSRRIFLHRQDGFPCVPASSAHCKFDTGNKSDNANWQRHPGASRFNGTSEESINSSEDCNDVSFLCGSNI